MQQWFDEIALAAGAIVIVLSLVAFRSTRRFIARCRTAEGRIAGYRLEESDEGPNHYYAQVRFADASGVEHELRGGHGLQEPPTVGERVPVTYYPDDPENAWITGTAAPWVIPWLVLLAGLGLAIAGVAIRYVD